MFYVQNVDAILNSETVQKVVRLLVRLLDFKECRFHGVILLRTLAIKSEYWGINTCI